MKERHHYRRLDKAALEPDMTTFLNLMVVLVPFLLITAVFSRITIVELGVPTSAGGSAPHVASFRVEVVVREDGFEIMDGAKVIAAIPKTDDAYDLTTLSDYLVDIKRQYPEKVDASVLLEPDIQYDNLIHVMDAVRSAEVPGEGDAPPTRLELFTDIAIGDAP